MKPLLVLLVFVTSSFCCMAATGMHVEKGTCPVEKKKVTKNMAQLALKAVQAVQAVPEKQAPLPDDHIIGFSLFKF